MNILLQIQAKLSLIWRKNKKISLQRKREPMDTKYLLKNVILLGDILHLLYDN